MALPAGVTTATVTVGVPVSHTGAAVKTFVSIEPSAFLVHAETGTPLVDFLEELQIAEGVSGQFTLPHTDQAGFTDEAGNAYTNWYYTARISYSTPSKAKSKAPKIKVFQLTTGQTTVDLDKLPGGAPALPYTAATAKVDAFNGRTGAVELLESDLPERISDTSLNATYGPSAAGMLAAFATKAEATGGDKANTVIIFGDSLTAQSGTGAETLDPISAPDAVDGRGYWHWANGFLGRKLKLVRNAGIGGNTSAQMLARINADVLAHPSGWVFLCAGANDIAQDRTLAAVQADMNAILDALIGAGRRVLVMTAPPSSSYTTTARKEVLGKFNDWIRDLPLTRPGVVVADTYKVLTDPATGFPASGMVTDLVHWSEAGALRVGKAVADAMTTAVVNRPNKVISLVDPNNVVGNPHMASGTGWATVGAGFTAAYAVDPATFRTKATLTYTAGTGAEDTGIQYVEPIANGRYAAGDIVQASVRLKWSNVVAGTSSTVGFIPFLRVWPRKVDNSFGNAALAFQTSSSNRVAVTGIPSSGELVAATHRLTLPANVNNLYVAAGFTGIVSGTLEISEFSVWKNA